MSLVSAGSGEGQVIINNRPVCDQDWDDVDAGVLCRMLGYAAGRATTGSQFGEMTSNYLMTEVRCSGTELSLLDCPHSRLASCASDQVTALQSSLFSIQVLHYKIKGIDKL